MSAEFDPEFSDVAQRLEHERPVPAAAFRGDLRRRLVAPGGSRRRPSGVGRIRLLIAVYASSGLALLAIATGGVAGAGPFAA